MDWTDIILLPQGHPQGAVAMTAAILIRLVLITAYGWFVLAGFRTNWKWGIGNLLLPPIALAFFYLCPERGRRPGILLLIGMLGFMLTMVVFKQQKLEPRDPPNTHSPSAQGVGGR